VIPLPGAVAAICGLIVSGLPTGRFSFEGFLSVNRRNRVDRLKQLALQTNTLIFYEAPHKLNTTLNDLYIILGNRRIAIGRELTKKFEEIKRGMLSKIISEITPREIKGELTIVLEGQKEKKNEPTFPIDDSKIENEIKKKMKNYLKKGYYNKDIVLLITREYQVPKNWVYRKLLDHRN